MQDREQEMRTLDSCGLDPLMAKSMRELLGDIPKRLVALVNKFLGVETLFRIIAFGISTWLVATDAIGDYAWLIATAFLIFGKEALDTVEKIRR